MKNTAPLLSTNFTLLVISEEEYQKWLTDTLKQLSRMSENVCYVCLSRPYEDVLRMFREQKIDISRFFFIDTLTPNYVAHKSASRCLFLAPPPGRQALLVAIDSVCVHHKAAILLIDSVSSLLVYEEPHEIVHFTNNLVSDERYRTKKKVFVVLKEDSFPPELCELLVKDLQMFADRNLEPETVIFNNP